MLLRKCNGKAKDSANLSDNEILEIFNYEPKEDEEFQTIINNDFECASESGQGKAYPPFHTSECIIRGEIYEERECKNFQPCTKSL